MQGRCKQDLDYQLLPQVSFQRRSQQVRNELMRVPIDEDKMLCSTLFQAQILSFQSIDGCTLLS